MFAYPQLPAPITAQYALKNPPTSADHLTLLQTIIKTAVFMAQIARNNYSGATMYFDKATPAPLPTRRVFHNLTRLATQFNVLPKLVVLHPPEPSTFRSKRQKKPINIFKKLVPKLETSLPHKSSCEWTMVPPSVRPSDAPAVSKAGLATFVLPAPTFEQALSVESSPSNSLYSPQSALIEALGLAFDRVIPIAPLSYGEGGQGINLSNSNVKPTRSQARVLRRKSRYPHPMILSPPQCSQPLSAPSKKVPHGMPGNSLRRPSSSSRRTSRSLMVGHNPKKPTYTYRRQSVYSSLTSIIEAAAEFDQPLTGIHGHPSSRHIQVPIPAKLILPPVEIHPLTFSPFLAEFGDHASSDGGSSVPCTPSITIPPSDIASLAYVSSQKEIRSQKSLRRYGRCPSEFLNLAPSSPIALPIEQPRTDPVPAPTALNPPPRFDSLRGCSRASLDRAMEVALKARTEATESSPSKASLRPKLTLHIPKTGGPLQGTVIHRPVASVRHCTDDIKVDTRRCRPLPSTPITRQRSV